MATKISVKACSMNGMADSARKARGRCHTSFGYPLWITATHACLFSFMLVMAWGGLCWCGPAQGAELKQPAQTLVPSGPLTYDEAVKIAIRQSPYFTKTSLEMDIRGMDETDSRYGMVPPLTFRTYYYVNQPSGINSKPYSLSFTTDPYNPLGSYFTLQAQKLVTQIALFNHLKIISMGLQRLGMIYLDLDALKKIAAFQRDHINLVQETLTYAQNRLSIGTGTSLDVKVAQQELMLAKGEMETITFAQKRSLNNLKAFLGLPETQEITPDLHDSRRQVLGSFDPATATVEQAKSRNYELKVLDNQRKLQGYNVSLAITKAFPSILFNTQSPDPLSVTTAHGLYVGFGLEIPVWDGFKRIRNISRQKAMQKQLEAQKETTSSSLADKWLEDLGTIKEKEVDLNYAKSQEDLIQLKAHQNEVRYQSGGIPLSIILESRKEVVAAQKNTLRKTLDYDKSVLKFREISGDLGYTYVDPSSWQK